MILTRIINSWTTGNMLSMGYASDGLWQSSPSNRYSVVSPDFCSLDVGGVTHRWDEATTLDLTADDTWDFGQSIGTWQAGHEYNVGDWVRPTSYSSFLTSPSWDSGISAASVVGTKPSGRRGHVSVSYNNCLYIFGGWVHANSQLNDVWKFDIITNTWTTCSCSGTPPDPRAFGIAFLYNNYMYVMGGLRNSTLVYYNDVHRLNLDTLTWSGALSCSGTPPTARAYHTGVVYGNKLYVTQGSNPTSDTGVYALDLETLDWGSSAVICSGSPPSARYGLRSVVYNGSMYVFGGYFGTYPYLDTVVYKLNLTTFAWTTVTTSGTPPVGRMVHSLTLVGNRMYVFGGFNNNSTYYNDLSYLNLDTSVWSSSLTLQGTTPAVRGYHVAENLQGKIIIHDGNIDQTIFSANVGYLKINYRCTTAGTSHSSEPSWGTTVSGTTTETGGVVWTAYYDDTKALNRAGQDFYIYACQTAITAPKLIASRNSTYPHGYTASNSRKIGGFHCLCNSVGTIANHDLTGYVTGDILPRSVWCLDHKSDSGSNVGVVFDPKQYKWVGIYLVSGTKTAPTNVYGGTILDTITWYEACDAATLLNMRLPGDAEFQTFAAGSPEAVNIYGGSDPVTVGGYVSTGSVRMISNIGCEGCAGQMYQWLDETSYRFGNTTDADTGYTAVTHTHTVTLSGESQTATSANSTPSDIAPTWSWKNKTGGKGQLYTQGTHGIVKVVAGGMYNQTDKCGSRARGGHVWPWDITDYTYGVTTRLISGHISRSI